MDLKVKIKNDKENKVIINFQAPIRPRLITEIFFTNNIMVVNQKRKTVTF